MNQRYLIGALFTSAVVNVVLLVALFLVWQTDPPMEVTLVRPPTVTNILKPMRTNVTVEARSLRWSDIESTNYFLYISNLRGFGCPEPTLRDIITAEIDELYADRLAREVVTPAHQWWRTTPDPELKRLANEQKEALDAERRQLLAQLLGPEAQAAVAETRRQDSPTPLDGPILGSLTDAKRILVRGIEERHRDRVAALSASDEDAPPNPPEADEIARSEADARAELARVLSPEELEEYLLRYSRTADQLRSQTAKFEPTQEEFRALFRAVDPLNQELAALSDDASEKADIERVELLAKREAAMEDVLDTKRYAQLQLTQDPYYIAVRDTAKRLSLPDSQVLPMYEINQLTREERTRILNDASMTTEEQTEQLASIEQARLDSLRRLLGETAFRQLHTTSGP